MEGPGGVFVFGTYEEDGPVTWEAQVFPRVDTATGEPGQESPMALRQWVHVGSGNEKRPSRGRREARGTGAEAERSKPKDIWESEGRI